MATARGGAADGAWLMWGRRRLILFTSRQFDAETGLYFNRARYLDPTTGRWTTQDPLGFAAGDANLYRYVGNMTTMATDPSGLQINPLVAIPGIRDGGGWNTDPHRVLQITLRDNAAVANGLANAVWSVVTLGNGNRVEPYRVPDNARDTPYYVSESIYGVLGSVGIAGASGATAQASGIIGGVGRVLLGYDFLGNGVCAVRGGVGIVNDRPSVENITQLSSGVLGLAGNYLAWRTLPPRPAPAGPRVPATNGAGGPNPARPATATTPTAPASGGSGSGNGTGLGANGTASPPSGTPRNLLAQVSDTIIAWLGPRARILRDDSRGFVILSEDGLRRFRIDYAGPGTPPPHAHFEVWDAARQRWVDAIPGQHRLPFGG
ncbi:MAG: RHS repeat-associated core domain-containing protein [Gemmataceae bacterium]|nr:RHS repeat-associated core domain-containing protein [Gemmataceae bacterium]